MSTSLPDKNQNFWQLASIQSVSQSIPSMLLGGVLSAKYGASTAIPSIIIGNLILWIIGLGIISLSARGRKNTIETVTDYLGKWSSLILALVLMAAFISWYMLEIQTTTSSLAPLLSSSSNEKLVWIGGGLGLIITLLSFGGIRLIKWLSLISFPFLILICGYRLFNADISLSVKGSWNIAFPAVLAAVTISFPGIVNLPTFFRHSHSLSDSFLALTLLTVFDILFEILTVFIGATSPSQILMAIGGSYPLAGITCVLISSFCLNLVNIYFASASLEFFGFSSASRMKYLITGALGTLAFILIHNYEPILSLENMTGNFIGCLGIVILISHLIKLVIKHRPRAFEKFSSSWCWITGCIASLITQAKSGDTSKSFLMGLSVSLLSFLVIIFIEESVWAIKRLYFKKNIRNMS